MKYKIKKKSYIYEYLILFLIYVENLIKYYLYGQLYTNSFIGKIYPITNNKIVIDEECGSENIDCVIIFDKSSGIINQYSIKSKDKLD